MAGQGKKVFCEVCAVTLPSASLLPTHNKGKRHQRLLHLQEEREDSGKRSIYVRGFGKSGCIEEDLTSYFSNYGKVSNMFLDKEKKSNRPNELKLVHLKDQPVKGVHPARGGFDSNFSPPPAPVKACIVSSRVLERCLYLKKHYRGVYAIVEFATAEDAALVLKTELLPLLNGKRLTVKARNLPKESAVHQKHIRQNQKTVLPRHGVQRPNQQMAPFLSEELIDKLKSSLTFVEQVQLLMQNLCLSDEELKLRKLVCQLLQEVFQEVYPQASVVPFGSTVSGAGWKGSDLDVCLLTSDTQASFEVVNYSLITDVLRSFAPGCGHVIPVLTAKCPLIKFIHQPSKLSCDLSVNNRLGIANSDLLRCYLSLDPRVPQLVFMVRAWAKAKNITAGKQLSNYAVTLMVLYFLQTRIPPVIPSLQQSIDDWIDHDNKGHAANYETKTINNWNCSFFADLRRLSPSKNTRSLSELLEEFFSFYANKFDFHSFVVSVRAGYHTSIASVLEELTQSVGCVTPVSRDLPTEDKMQTEVKASDSLMAQTNTQLSNAMTEFKLRSSEASEQDTPCSKGAEFKVSAMCLQDPFELSHNLTQNVPCRLLNRILGLMKDAEKICKNLNVGACGVSNENSTTLLELLTVPKVSKKRKAVNCYTFFVKYQNAKVDTSLDVDLNSSRGIFQFIVESFQREFRMTCELKCARKKQRTEENGSLSMGALSALCDTSSGNVAITSCHSVDQGGAEILEISEDNLRALCTAFENTWTHCRQERRKSLQKHESENILGKLPVGLDLNQKQETLATAEAGKEINGNPSPEHFTTDEKVIVNSSMPLLIFELRVNSSSQLDKTVEGCNVSMELIDSNESELFGNFFSAYKKFFMGCLSKETG